MIRRVLGWLLLVAAVVVGAPSRVSAQAAPASAPAGAPAAVNASTLGAPAAAAAGAAGVAAGAAAQTPGAAGAAATGFSVRLGDLAYVQGVRNNQLLGLGLVTGLAGKGDSTSSSLLQQAVANLISSFGIQIAQKDIKSRNCAVVMVTAELPPFARPGDPIPVTVSSVGDAQDLTGGMLLQTTLRAANGETYAVAQGPIASTSSNDTKTVGGIPSGAIVERAVASSFVDSGRVSIVLRDPDFVNAAAAEQAIRTAFPNAAVAAVDAADIDVTIPADRASDPVGFVAALQQLTITPDVEGRVVVNPRTGVVVVGRNVRIGRVAVSYRDTRISIGYQDLSSPYLGIGQPKNPFVIGDTATVDDLVKVLQDAGVTGDTIIEILKAIDRAGALYGKLIVM